MKWKWDFPETENINPEPIVRIWPLLKDYEKLSSRFNSARPFSWWLIAFALQQYRNPWFQYDYDLSWWWPEVGVLPGQVLLLDWKQLFCLLGAYRIFISFVTTCPWQDVLLQKRKRFVWVTNICHSRMLSCWMKQKTLEYLPKELQNSHSGLMNLLRKYRRSSICFF